MAAFVAVSTQWRVAPLGRGRVHYVGLDYAGAKAGLALAGITLTAEQWEGVRVMEAEAIATLNARSTG